MSLEGETQLHPTSIRDRDCTVLPKKDLLPFIWRTVQWEKESTQTLRGCLTLHET